MIHDVKGLCHCHNLRLQCGDCVLLVLARLALTAYSLLPPWTLLGFLGNTSLPRASRISLCAWLLWDFSVAAEKDQDPCL